MFMRKYRKIVPVKKELDIGKTITCKLKFIDSFRFMQSSLSSLVDNLSEIYSKKCNCKSMCDFIGLKNDKFYYKCKEYKKRLSKSINELIKKFSNTHKFCNEYINKFIQSFKKGIYPCQDMDSWKGFDETSLPDKKAFHNEDIWKRLLIKTQDACSKST